MTKARKLARVRTLTLDTLPTLSRDLRVVVDQDGWKPAWCTRLRSTATVVLVSKLAATRELAQPRIRCSATPNLGPCHAEWKTADPMVA